MITAYQKQGPRPYQEDRYWFSENLMMVADGHSGSEVSERIKNWFEGGNFENLIDTFKELDIRTKGYSSGSTLSVVNIRQQVAEVAILGDSPVVILGTEGKVSISPEHNVRTNPKAAQEGLARGAFIYNGYLCDVSGRGLQMSRALGDKYLYALLSREPEIYSVELDEKSVILVASDGLFDPAHLGNGLSLEAIVEILKEGADAKDLIKAVDDPQDNITAVVWRKN